MADAGGVTGDRLPRPLRVRRRTDFERVYASSAYAADPVLVAHGCRNGLAVSRLGLSVSRRVGNAVVRNRWKRLIREAFRRSRDQLPAGYDFVIRPRSGAQPVYAAIVRSLPRLLRKLTQRL